MENKGVCKEHHVLAVFLLHRKCSFAIVLVFQFQIVLFVLLQSREKEKAAEWREKLIETIVEQDSAALIMFLEGESPSEEKLKELIQKGTPKLSFVLFSQGLPLKIRGYHLFLMLLLITYLRLLKLKQL